LVLLIVGTKGKEEGLLLRTLLVLNFLVFSLSDARWFFVDPQIDESNSTISQVIAEYGFF
jgi:hypothetical protein